MGGIHGFFIKLVFFRSEAEILPRKQKKQLKGEVQPFSTFWYIKISKKSGRTKKTAGQKLYSFSR